MRKVYAIGESLVDLISKNGKEMERKAGGSMLNASVSLGRFTIPVYLISEVGKDGNGDYIIDFLRSNGVDVSYIKRFDTGKTALALAELDENNNATYRFVKDYPPNRLLISVPDFKTNDIFLFGSIYALEEEIRSQLLALLDLAAKAHCLKMYDPNIRRSNQGKIDQQKVMENFTCADIIRASNEDMFNVFGQNDFASACSVIPDIDSKVFIYTCAEKGVFIKTPLYDSFYSVPKIKVISSIGAGDSFNAGIIYGLLNSGTEKQEILRMKKEKWDRIINLAIAFASNACESYDNYVSMDFGKKLLSQ